MGCDIHLTLERRLEDQWVAIDTFCGHHRAKWTMKDKKEFDYSSPVVRDRNYVRFAMLAAVRGDGPEPRGIPSDASETTMALIKGWGGDGHSHSWLPLSEAAKVWIETDRYVDDWGKKYPESYYFNVDCSEGSEDRLENYRVVFWFDN